MGGAGSGKCSCENSLEITKSSAKQEYCPIGIDAPCRLHADLLAEAVAVAGSYGTSQPFARAMRLFSGGSRHCTGLGNSEARISSQSRSGSPVS
jgi:hypothetical protein